MYERLFPRGPKDHDSTLARVWDSVAKRFSSEKSVSQVVADWVEVRKEELGINRLARERDEFENSWLNEQWGRMRRGEPYYCETPIPRVVRRTPDCDRPSP
jgi:hypothetical protein